MTSAADPSRKPNVGPWFAFRFVRWADAQPRPLTWQQVQAFLGCSRAKAFRWLSHYNAWRAPEE